MNKQVNFEDSIFIALMRIKMIADIITLDGDPEFFLDKVMDDLSFTDQLLRLLLEQLSLSYRLITRDELLQNLSDAENQFTRLLSDFLDHEGNISIKNIAPICEKLQIYQKSSKERRENINNLCNKNLPETDDDVVGSEELRELLKAF